MNPIQRMLKTSRMQEHSIDSFVDHPGLTEQLLRVQGLDPQSWMPPSIKQALSIPAVFRAVTLIANIVGSLTLQAWRDGQLLRGPAVPRLVSRPAVFTTPRDFLRDTAYCLASRGEYIWWIVDRDTDGFASKFLLLPPHEVTVKWNQNFSLMRDYRWRNKDIPADDIEHGTFLREPGSLRGIGPLQVCGAALSVAVEAEEWAARFFRRGGAPATIIDQPNVKLNKDESERLLDQYLARESNEARVISGGVRLSAHQVDPESAQLLQSRQYSALEVATMFGMDGELLNAGVAGSSLTYANVGQRFDNFARMTLVPNYLEPIEHGISERLSRTTVARFALQTFLRADVKTQAEVYAAFIGAGMDSVQAASLAGIDSLVDVEPVPAPIEVSAARIPVA